MSAEPPQGMSREGYCRNTAPSVLEIQGHSAPMSMAFYGGTQFPAEYAGDAFVALRGSWNRNPPTGYEVARIRFDTAGDPVGVETFATGWLIEDGTAHFGRVTGLPRTRDGALLVGDHTNGIIYRIAYTAGT